MQLRSKYSKELRFWLCVIDIYRKYTCEEKESVVIIQALQRILDDSGHKPNKLCVDQGSEFYNRSIE